MSRHRSLIETQANISQIEEFQESRRIESDRFETYMRNEELVRSRALHCWLKAADVDSDQYHFAKLRADYPETGKWLLKHAAFKQWFDPHYAIVPPLLWLNGIPGAGKCSNSAHNRIPALTASRKDHSCVTRHRRS
jgi:hypothetical protein